MKRYLLTTLAAAAVLGAIVIGPDFAGLLRLDEYIKSSAQAYEAERGPWPQVSDTCIGCHGVDGGSLNQNYPSLAGQPASYLSEQLRRFASGQRVHPIMNAMARSLNEDEIALVAGHFARRRAGENRFFTPDAALRETGRQLVAAGGCAACHGDGLEGRDSVPRLGGQGYDYLLKQLDGFADGTRRDPASTMNALASSWAPDQRMAIASYLARATP